MFLHVLGTASPFTAKLLGEVFPLVFLSNTIISFLIISNRKFYTDLKTCRNNFLFTNLERYVSC